MEPSNHPTINIGNYTFIDKSLMNVEQWLKQRTFGIGGSEIGTIMGVNPYGSSLRLFYEKCGLHSPKNLEKNASIFWGRMSEDNIRVATQYWDRKDPLQYTLNYSEGKQQFVHMDFDFFAIHSKYPWLQANVDGLGWNHTNVAPEKVVNAIKSGKLIHPDKIIEIKTISSRSRDKWKAGIPYGYFLQVLAYMMVWKETNSNLYGEIYSLVDGNSLEMHEVPWDDDLVNLIEEKCVSFWEGVKAVRHIMETEDDENVILDAVIDLQPSADGSEDYYKFLSEKQLKRLADNKNKKTGEDSVLQAALQYESITQDLAQLEEKKKYLKNIIAESLAKNRTSILDFGDRGYVKRNKALSVNVK